MMDKTKELKFDDKGLIPAVIQDVATHKVLMLGYMNQEAFDKTLETGLVTFFSRSRNQLWTKGETSGNFLKLDSWLIDCDSDSLLIRVTPAGPVCHTGSDTCWAENNDRGNPDFLEKLQTIIKDRYNQRDEQSYTSTLFEKGRAHIAQKVGEEAVELIIESMQNSDDLFMEEAADLLFHYLVLLQSKEVTLAQVVEVLENRHR